MSNNNTRLSAEDSRNLIFILESYYEESGIESLKIAAEELSKFLRKPVASKVEEFEYTPDIPIRMAVVMRIGCNYLKVQPELILSPSRTLAAMVPRHIIMYLGKELTNLSFLQLADWFKKDHTTVIHAHAKIKEQIKTQNKIKQYIDEITVLCQKQAVVENLKIQELKKCQEAKNPPILTICRKPSIARMPRRIEHSTAVSI